MTPAKNPRFGASQVFINTIERAITQIKFNALLWKTWFFFSGSAHFTFIFFAGAAIAHHGPMGPMWGLCGAYVGPMGPMGAGAYSAGAAIANHRPMGGPMGRHADTALYFSCSIETYLIRPKMGPNRAYYFILFFRYFILFHIVLYYFILFTMI